MNNPEPGLSDILDISNKDNNLQIILLSIALLQGLATFALNLHQSYSHRQIKCSCNKYCWIDISDSDEIKKKEDGT